MTRLQLHSRAAAGLVVIALLSRDSIGRSSTPPGMARIPALTIQLGSSIDEIVDATAECSRRSLRNKGGPACEPEDLFDEVQSGPPVEVSTFFIDVRETSVAQYSRCVEAVRCRPPAFESSVSAFASRDNPVVLVSYYDAKDYCQFRNARLPTEAEFEVAARGARLKRYPWGDHFYNDLSNAGSGGQSPTDSQDGYELLAPIQSFVEGRSPQGVLNLAGNAAEWTQSYFRRHGATPEAKNTATLKRVVKGGHFAAAPHHLRGAARQAVQAHDRHATIGFRCAHSIPDLSKH